ncbi:MAG: amidohydrolase family protein [Hyphomicrobiaceae bacterium]
MRQSNPQPDPSHAAPKMSRRSFVARGAAVVAVNGLVSSAAAQQAPGIATKRPIVIANVSVFDGVSATLRTGMTVLVEGEKIVSIETGAVSGPPGALVVQGNNGTLMPGLIDNHTHIFMAGTSQVRLLNPAVPFKDLEVTASDEAKKMLLRGITSARDVGGPVFGVKKLIDEGKNIGPRIYPSGALISQTSGHGDFRKPTDRAHRFGGGFTRGELLGAGFIADGRDEVLTATRENLRGGTTQIKILAGGGAASTYDPLDVTQYTLDELKAAVEAADDWNTYVTAHAYTPKAIRRAVEAGIKCIEHGQLADDDTIKYLADKGVWLSLQSLDEAPPSAPEAIRIKKRMVVEGTSAAFVSAKKHKVKLAFGTDLMFDPKQMTKQNTDILKLKQWFTSAEALKLMTHDNAQLLALSGPRNAYPGKLGVVEKGALADLIVVSGNPLDNLELVADPDKNFKMIMKNGVIYKNTL